MQIPKWLHSYLKADAADTITEAIRQAETTTSGELVPMIVRRSSTVGHVPLLLFTLFVALFFVLGGTEWQAALLGDHWAWFIADIGILLILTALFARMQWVQRLLTPRADQAEQVNARAIIEFYESNIHQTKDATGVLIMVSLMEHRAVVLADSAINELVEKDTWQGVCDRLITGIKKKNLCTALKEVILECGEIMTPHFPIQPDDENELKDQLIIKE